MHSIFNRCRWLGYLLIAVGAAFVVFNISLKTWMILFGAALIALGIFLLR